MNQVMEVRFVYLFAILFMNIFQSVGETCINNQNMSGTYYGQFRCPLNGFPYEARYCCGKAGKQYCCIRQK